MCFNITNILDWFNNEFLYLFEDDTKEEPKDLSIFEEYNWDLF